MILLAVRSLKTRVSRTALTTAGIVLGVAVILAIRITNLSALDSITSVFNEASGRSNLVITGTGSIGSRGFDESVVRRAAGVAGVEVAVPSLQAQTLLADDLPPSQVGISMLGAAFEGILVYGIDPALDPQVREYKLAAGRFVESDLDAREIVLGEEYARSKKIDVGEDIRLLSPTGPEVVRVVGLLSKDGPGQLNNGLFGVMPLHAAQELFHRVGEIDQIDIVAVPSARSTAGLDSLKAVLQERMGDRYSVLYPATQGKRVAQMLSTYQMGLMLFSAVALFVGAFLIYNAFSMTVVERTREIGMLRTVGMTRGQVMSQILVEATVVGVVGAAVGVGVGFGLAQGLIRMMEIILSQDLRNPIISTDSLLVSTVVGIITALLAAAIPAWQAGRVSPLEALRVRGNPRESWVMRRAAPVGTAILCVSSFLIGWEGLSREMRFLLSPIAVFSLFVGATLLVPVTVTVWERLARPGVKRIYGNEGQLGSSNVQRAKLRTTLTVAALMVGAAMILTIRSTTTSFANDIRSWLDVYVGGDLLVHSQVPMRDDLGKRLEGIPGVQAVTPVRYIDVEWAEPDGADARLTFMAIDPAIHRRVTDVAFTANQGNPDQLLAELDQGNVLFISSVMAEKYGLGRGDLLTLYTRRGAQVFRVAAVVVNYQSEGQTVTGSFKDLRRYFGVNDVTVFLLRAQPSYSVDKVRADIERIYGKRRHLTVDSNRDLKARAYQLTSRIFAVFDVLALIAMVVASLGVVNTLMMNVMERTREIGMLRSMGMTKRQVAKMVLAESGMMGLIGGVFGLLFGVVLSRLFMTAASAVEGYAMTFILSRQGVIVCVVVALVVSQLAAIWPARRAAGLRIIEAIHFE